MKHVIYKYQLQIEDQFTVSLPSNHKILYVDAQAGIPYIWVLVNPDTVEELVTIRTYSTGHLIKDLAYLEFIGTVQLNGFVWHYFKEKN